MADMSKRTIRYEIPTEYSGKKVSEFLRNQEYSRQSLAVLRWQKHAVLVNGEPRHLNDIVHEGDSVTIMVMEPEEHAAMIVPVELPFDVVYEDEDLVIVNKPAGMPCQPSFYYERSSLANAAAYYYHNSEEPVVFRCINRIDRDTTGLVILAKHYIGAGILGNMMTKREIHRTYVAIVEDSAEHELPDAGVIDLPIGKKMDEPNTYQVDERHGQSAVTHYEVIRRLSGAAVVQLQLETGRTHQIRVHMSAIGHPLLGDERYHAECDTLMTRQALHSVRLVFSHPFTRKQMDIQVAVPEDMQRCISQDIRRQKL